MPSHVVKHQATELLVQIHLPESAGLSGVLLADEDAEAKPEDVRSTPFKVTFPLGLDGKPEPSKASVTLTSPAFDPPSQTKNLFIPPDADADVLHFLLTPMRTGKLTVLVELQWEDATRGSRSLRTECVAEAASAPLNPQMNLVRMPVDVSVGGALVAPVVEVAKLQMEIERLDREADRERVAQTAMEVERHRFLEAKSTRGAPPVATAGEARNTPPPAPPPAAPPSFAAPATVVYSGLRIPPDAEDYQAQLEPPRPVQPPAIRPQPQVVSLPLPRPKPPESRWGIRAALIVLLVGIGGGGLWIATLPLAPRQPVPGIPTATLTAEPTTVEKGQSAMLRWSSQNATDLDLEPGVGKVQAEGSASVTLQDSTTFTLTATGPGGAQSSSARVSVLVPTTPPPIPRGPGPTPAPIKKGQNGKTGRKPDPTRDELRLKPAQNPPPPAKSAELVVAGRVVDSDTSVGLGQSNINLAGRLEGYVTDDNGNFWIRIGAPSASEGVRLQVKKSGCTSVDQAIRPPVENLVLVLNCAHSANN